VKWPENVAAWGSMRNAYLREVDENNIKISLEETEWKVLNWINPARNGAVGLLMHEKQ
jgi:hypothetical protein